MPKSPNVASGLLHSTGFARLNCLQRWQLHNLNENLKVGDMNLYGRYYVPIIIKEPMFGFDLHTIKLFTDSVEGRLGLSYYKEVLIPALHKDMAYYMEVSNFEDPVKGTTTIFVCSYVQLIAAEGLPNVHTFNRVYDKLTHNAHK